MEGSLEALHFLRPQALWLLLAVAVVTVLLWLADSRKSGWQQFIPAHLRAYVVSEGSRGLNRRIIATFGLIGILLSLGLAGPAWKKVRVPGQVQQSVLLIGLDMSQSMNAQDISPTRLEHAKLKIQDLLNQEPGIRTGLIGYAGTPHLILPPTGDYNLINFQSETLASSMMPVKGSDIIRMINYADTLLNAQPVPGTLLIITDEVTSDQASYLSSYIQRNAHTIEIWIISSREGGEPRDSRTEIMRTADGNPVLSRPDEQILNTLENQERINVQWITLDTSDAEQIAERIGERLNVRESDEVKEDIWEDCGLLLVWPAAAFLLLWFRKGWVVQFTVIAAVAMSCDPTGKHADWWYSTDYQAQAYYARGDYEQAAALYSDAQDQGIAYYKAGDYESAAALFAEDSTDAGRYRLGLALFQLGDYESAASALQGLDSTDTSPAGALLEQIYQNMAEVDSVTRFSQDPEKPPLDNESPQNLRRAKGKDEELTSDTEVEELPTGGNRVADEVATDIRKAKELDAPPEEKQEGVEIDPGKILLQQTEADPAEFLRKRFRLQYNRYYKNVTPTDQQW